MKVLEVNDHNVVAENFAIPVSDIVFVETQEATVFGIVGATATGLALGYLFVEIPAALLMAMIL